MGPIMNFQGLAGLCLTDWGLSLYAPGLMSINVAHLGGIWVPYRLHEIAKPAWVTWEPRGLQERAKPTWG